MKELIAILTFICISSIAIYFSIIKRIDSKLLIIFFSFCNYLWIHHRKLRYYKKI